MRISDWSSDVCSSDLDRGRGGAQNRQSFYPDKAMQVRPSAIALIPLLLFLALFFGAGIWFTLQGEPMGFYQLRAPVAILPALALAAWLEIGRASCRERVCQYV